MLERAFPPRLVPDPLNGGVSCKLSSCSKSNRRFTAGWEYEKAGLVRFLDARGRIADCLRGDEPRAVFIGDRDRGGGRLGLFDRSRWWPGVRSGISPSRTKVSE